MPTPVSTARQCLTDEAARVLDDAVAVAIRRSHAQTTSLHAVSALLALPSSTLLEACGRARSSTYSPRIQFRALELCVGVSLDRLPTSKSANEPPVSNSLMAAINRSQANQKRQAETFHLYPQMQLQNPSALTCVKVELKHFILSILDDPIVSRVFEEAGFRGSEIKLAILTPPNSQLSQSRVLPRFNLLFAGVEYVDENLRRIREVLVKAKAKNPILIGVCANDALSNFTVSVQTGKASELPGEIEGLSVITIGEEIHEFVVNGGSKEKIDLKIKEISDRTESCSGCGVAVNYGELKVFVNGGSVDLVNYVVSKLSGLLVVNGGKLWLIGAAASDDTYKKFLARFPSIEKDWDLCVLPVTSSTKPSIGGSYSKSSHESFSKSKAVEEVVEDKLKSIKQVTVPMEIQRELKSSNQEASSLTVEWNEISHESNSNSKAVDDKLKSIEQVIVPMEVQSKLESSNQEASSLTVDWNEISHESNSKSKAVEDKLKSIKQVTCPVELESELESLNQEASSLTMDWTALEVNLTNGRCSELPENPSCSFLVKLFLHHNSYLTEIPASFFEDMPVLRVLDMSNTSIKTLPSSISKLFRLRELLLRGCEMLMELPPEIGRLTNLKVLDLEGTEIVFLPKEVGWLRQLECLKFSLYRYADPHEDGIKRSIISKETLPKLSSLKELSIDVDPNCEWWDAEVEAIITDLGKLGNLEILKLYLPTLELFQQLLQRRCVKQLEWDVVMPLLYPTLSNFRFVVGRHEDPIMSCVPRDLQEEFVKLEKCLKYVNGEEYLDAKALEHVGALFLNRHWNICTLSELDLRKMDNLKFCLLAECDQMRAILNGPRFKGVVDNRGGEPILRSLRYLGIHYMKNLYSICEGPIGNGSLSSLKFLAIHTCPKLATIFNLELLDNLIFLQELIIEDCHEVQNLITEDYSLLKKELLPSLEKISLLHLPSLKNISRGQWIAPGLDKMVIYNCPKLKNLHPLETCSRNVKEIKGERKWWESNKSGWSSEQHDYLVRVFVPLKGEDDDDDNSIDEVAEAVQISLMSQITSTDEHAAGKGKDEDEKHVAGRDKDEDMT